MDSKKVLSLMRPPAFPENPSPIRFVSSDITTDNRFVAWIDIMGAAAAMRRSLVESASKIGKFNAAVLMAHKAAACKDDVTFHTMTDGAYLVAKSAQSLQSVLAGTLANIARVFLSASRRNRFVVRCAVAYGEIVTSEVMDERMRANSELELVDKAILRNVMLGGPFATAYGMEGCAPPFGVYVDQSAVRAGFAEKSIWHWWVTDDDSIGEFIRLFKMSLEQHFAYIEEHYYDHMLSASKIAEYRAKIRSYFRGALRRKSNRQISSNSEPILDDDVSDDSTEEG